MNASWTIQLLVSLRLMMNEPTGEMVLYVVCATGNHSSVWVLLSGRGNVWSSMVPTDVLMKGILVCGLEIVGVSGQILLWQQMPLLVTGRCENATTSSVSWSAMCSNDLARTVLLNVPLCVSRWKPRHTVQRAALWLRLCRAANQTDIFTPAGMAIIVVVDVEYARVSVSVPTVISWWVPTINPIEP